MMTRINISGIDYEIVYRTSPVDNGQLVWGYTDYEHAKIVINSDLAGQKQRQTLMHELVHVAIHESGRDDLCNDETLVNPLGNVLFSMIAFNKDLVRDL